MRLENVQWGYWQNTVDSVELRIRGFAKRLLWRLLLSFHFTFISAYFLMATYDSVALLWGSPPPQQVGKVFRTDPMWVADDEALWSNKVSFSTVIRFKCLFIQRVLTPLLCSREVPQSALTPPHSCLAEGSIKHQVLQQAETEPFLQELVNRGLSILIPEDQHRVLIYSKKKKNICMQHICTLVA